jgi:hypothetical protein
MLRPITVAPTLACASSTTGVLALTSPPSSPCCLRHASSLKTHWCSSMPPTPSGFSSLWSGPATNPSSDTASRNLKVLIDPSRPPWLGGQPLRLGSLSTATTTWNQRFRARGGATDAFEGPAKGSGALVAWPLETWKSSKALA